MYYVCNVSIYVRTEKGEDLPRATEELPLLFFLPLGLGLGLSGSVIPGTLQTEAEAVQLNSAQGGGGREGKSSTEREERACYAGEARVI